MVLCAEKSLRSLGVFPYKIEGPEKHTLRSQHQYSVYIFWRTTSSFFFHTETTCRWHCQPKAQTTYVVSPSFLCFFLKNTPRGTTIWNAQLLKFEMEIPGGFKTRVKVQATYQSVPCKVTLPLNSLDKRKKEKRKTRNHLAKLTAEREVRFLKHTRKLAQNRREWRTIVTALQASRHKSSQWRIKERGLGARLTAFISIYLLSITKWAE